LTENAPATLDICNADPEPWLTSRFDGTHPEWGDPDPNTVYTLFYPPTTKADSSSCDDAAPTSGLMAERIQHALIGDPNQCDATYHSAVLLPNGMSIQYAVISTCMMNVDSPERPRGFDWVTTATSHELIEASTDPLDFDALDKSGYSGVDDSRYYAWSFFASGELADMCESNADSAIRAFGFSVQRSWSNAAAAAGQEPCVPHTYKKPYFAALPVLPDVVEIPRFFGNVTTQGIIIHIGETRTLDVGLYSGRRDADDPIRVSAETVDRFFGGKGIEQGLVFSWDKDRGRAGETLHLSITALKNNPLQPSFLAKDAFSVRITTDNEGNKSTTFFTVGVPETDPAN
jgi:hypothetical protein